MIALPTTNPMPGVVKRLGRIGLNRSFVRERVLPAWWNDAIAQQPAGYAQGLAIMARNLGLDLRALQDEKADISLPTCAPVLNKKHEDVSETDLVWAQCLGSRVAELSIVAARGFPFKPTSAAAVREAIARKGPVTLERLLAYAWSIGIPVVFVSSLPAKSKKPDGMALRVDDRYAVVICRAEHSPAWMLFILAHELGHIALGHLPEPGAVVDERVKWTDDNQEDAANRFAVEVMTGSPDTRFRTDRWLSAAQLFSAARSVGELYGIDPGVVALNYAWNASFLAVARAALAELEAGQDALGTLRNAMLSGLDPSRVPEESWDFLLRVAGVESDE